MVMSFPIFNARGEGMRVLGGREMDLCCLNNAGKLVSSDASDHSFLFCMLVVSSFSLERQ